MTLHSVFSILLIVILSLTSQYESLASTNADSETPSPLFKDYPEPYSPHNRIFAMILAFNFDRIDAIVTVLHEYSTMCEAGWAPTINFITAVDVSDRLQRYIQKKTYCYRIQGSIPIFYRQHSPSEKFSISEHNREYVAENLHNHDLFIYQEEDIIVTLSHVMGFLSETKRLVQSHKGSTLTHAEVEAIMRQYLVGFYRFHRLRQLASGKSQDLSDDEMFSLEQLNEQPFFYPICINNRRYFEARTSKYYYSGNPHQAMYMLTKQQVHLLQDKCNFLNQTIKNIPQSLNFAREYTSSLSLYANSILWTHHCNLTKIVPAERLMSFTVEHAFLPKRGVSPVAANHHIFVVEEHLRAGMIQTNYPTLAAGYYDSAGCNWDKMVEFYRDRQHMLANNSALARKTTGKEVYLVQSGMKSWISNLDALHRHGFNEKDIVETVHPDAIDALSTGDPIH